MWTMKAMLDILNEVEACGHIYTDTNKSPTKGTFILCKIRLEFFSLR